MTVVCISNEKVETSLTVGRAYEEVPSPHYVLSDTIYVINDNCEVGGYFTKRFKEVENEVIEEASV